MPFFTPARPDRLQWLLNTTGTVAACTATTLVALPLLAYLDLANIVMLYLLTVLLVAVKLGRQAAILASVLSVLCFDLFFVPPRFSLAVNDVQYLVTFAVMLVTALTTTHFTSMMRQRALEATEREQRTQALYRLAKQLAGVLSIQQVIELTNGFVQTQLSARSAVLLPADVQKILAASPGAPGLPVEAHLVHMAFESGAVVRAEQVRELGYACLYLPLKASKRSQGVLAVAPEGQTPLGSETLSLLEAVASLIAVTLERLQFADMAQLHLGEPKTTAPARNTA